MVVLNFPFTFKIFFPNFSPSFFLSMAKKVNYWKPGQKRKLPNLFGITPLDVFVNKLDQKAKKREKYALLPKTAEHDKILSIMKDAGFIQFYWEPTGVFTYTAVNLKYIGHAKVGALRNIRRVSKSSKPVYLNTEELSRREKRFDFSILRTDRGLISGREALADNIGGELIIEINVAEE
jgi:small subunit ribosomal protein S8